MSRVGKKPVVVPAGVDLKVDGLTITAKGKNGLLSLDVHPTVEVKQEENTLLFAPRDKSKLANALSGTTRRLGRRGR
jgi:large subunit ribosomal protein L6